MDRPSGVFPELGWKAQLPLANEGSRALLWWTSCILAAADLRNTPIFCNTHAHTLLLQFSKIVVNLPTPIMVLPIKPRQKVFLVSHRLE